MSDSKRRRVGSASSLRYLDFTTTDKVCLRKEYEKQKPFSHLELSDFCDDKYLRLVRDEIISQLKADYKETDIFKVLQTNELANLDTNSHGLGHLVDLRDRIYSAEFRSFVEEVTGCSPLIEKADCSCNIYPITGHLLCHDDVIGSRSVSYILYLTDPDEEWLESDGGALELYPIGSEGEPDVSPSKKILPRWNQMVLFRVQPGVSFHSVQEVFTDSNHRLSISGWFHSSGGVSSNELESTLAQLKDQAAQMPPPSFTFQAEQEQHGLLKEDLKSLEQWVNKVYLDPENIEKIYNTFKEEGSIQLQDFLNEDKIKMIVSLLPESDQEILGSENGWEIQGPPHKQRYAKFNSKDCTHPGTCTELGCSLQQIETELFQSTAFCQLLHELTGLTCLGGNSEVRSFRRGSDYTIALYSQSKRETLDAVLCLVTEATEEAKAQWEYGEVGGFEAYLLADTKEESAADVYKAGGEDTGVLSVNPVSNTLNLVLADKGLIKFVKYVSSSAPGNRWDLSVEYEIEEMEDSQSEQED